MSALGFVVVEHGPDDPPLVLNRPAVERSAAELQAETYGHRYSDCSDGVTFTVCALVPIADLEPDVIARAIADPGSVTPRNRGAVEVESVPRWSTRAVLAVLGVTR